MAVRRTPLAAIRFAGVLFIALTSLYGAAVDWDVRGACTTALFGVFPLVAFLWLCVSGYFTWGSARRSDWVALPPFVLALLLREGFTLHSLQEIVISFTHGVSLAGPSLLPVGRHSIVYPLLQIFFVPLVDDAQAFVLHMNGVLGALATLPLYLFVRQRTGSRAGGFLSALLLATHPVLTRFSPTDGPYSMLLASWFSGLALLSSPVLDERAMFGGAALLGVAATCRMEGALFLIASVFLLDVRALLASALRHPRTAALSVLAIVLLEAVQMYFLLPFHLSGPTRMTSLFPSLDHLYDDAILPAPYNDRLFMLLVLTGALAGLVSKRHRLGLYAYAAMLVVLLPVVRSGFFVLGMHRMVPTCAVQTICAGIGAWWLGGWLPAWRGVRRAAVVPGTLIACYVLLLHWHELTERHAFNEEYDLVRSHLAPGGIVPSHCSLLTCNQVPGQDVDIHDFGHVVPGMNIVDCLRDDCIAAARSGGCQYYVRSAGCYFHSDGVPPTCAMDAVGDAQRCLIPPIAAFERSVALQPIEIRTVDLLRSFLRSGSYPDTAQVGLFKVGVQSADTSPPR